MVGRSVTVSGEVLAALEAYLRRSPGEYPSVQAALDAAVLEFLERRPNKDSKGEVVGRPKDENGDGWTPPNDGDALSWTLNDMGGSGGE